jgi:cellulose synthase (UDP-forming)
MLGTVLDLRSIGEKMALLAVILLIIVLFAYIVRHHRKYLKYFIALAILVQIIYITWRMLFTIPTQNAAGFVFGILLFIAELIAFVQSTTHRLMFMKDYVPVEKTLHNLKDLPTVDILIATYNEPVSVLQNTVAAAASQKYPKDKFTVYICDDGRREEVRQLAERYGAVWSVRDEHVHAKAGNLNHCLKNHARGELFVVLDADMITKSTFLERTVGYFEDPNMALVQAPQVFYNPDPFQNNLQLYNVIPNEQDFFMREILTRRGLFNAVLNVGSNAVFRRSAIDAIGLIPVGTITEDMATSMLLQAKGYQTIFINENLAMGLSPDSFADYVVQRDRWCRGNIQVLKKWNPLTLPGLSFMQRLIYFDGVLYWFFGLQKIIYNIGPILFLLTGVPVYYADVFTMLLFFAPTYYISSLIFTLFDHKSRTYTWAHIYETALAPYLAISALSELFLSRKLKFSVTPKGSAANKTYFAFRVALPHLVLAAAGFTALGFGIYKMLTDVNYMIPVYLVNLFWLLYNLLGVITAIFVCFEKQRYRSTERFIVEDQMNLTLHDGTVLPVNLVDISLQSCAVSPLTPLYKADSYVGSDVQLCCGASGLVLPGVLYRSRSWGKRIIINFKQIPDEQFARLVNFIFDRQQTGYGSFTQESSSFSKTLADIIRKWWRMVVLKK